MTVSRWPSICGPRPISTIRTASVFTGFPSRDGGSLDGLIVTTTAALWQLYCRCTTFVMLSWRWSIAVGDDAKALWMLQNPRSALFDQVARAGELRAALIGLHGEPMSGFVQDNLDAT